jgi:radical SAM superfamily enzyme YgiQ (UPF0313 family)
LLYIAKILESEGDEVNILDFSCDNFDKQKLSESVNNADVVGITVLSFSIKNSIEMIDIIRTIKPEIKVIVGGPHCTLFPKKVLNETKADICIQGDGEFVISDVKKAILGMISFCEISGIYYFENNEIKKGAPLKLIDDLDSIPFPSRNLIRKYNYGSQFNPHIKKGEFTSIITSRGCPYNCKFCSRNSVSMKKYRFRSVRNILDELIEISDEGYKYVAFVDDSFLSNKELSGELFDAIIKEKLKLNFIITAARVDSAEEELFKKMKKAGVTHIQYGLESGNQDVLDFYNKNTTLEKIKYAVNLSHKIGFFNMGSFIFGAPFETKNHFENTINFAKTLPLDSVSFVTLKYMAGSDLWCEAVNEGKISEDDYLVESNSENGLSLFKLKEIVNYCIKARGDFYMRPKFIIRLFIKSIKNDDLGFLQSYILLFFSNIIDGLKFLGITSNKKSYHLNK